jgi:hypothetical protein
MRSAEPLPLPYATCASPRANSPATPASSASPPGLADAVLTTDNLARTLHDEIDRKIDQEPGRQDSPAGGDAVRDPFTATLDTSSSRALPAADNG